MTPDRQHALEQLRSAIDRLPRGTREAMLAGVRSNTVITGAYTDSNRGVCPMLAAHRCGGRTDFLSFADAWDQFTGVYGRKICRSATGYEVRILVNALSESLGLAVTNTSDLTTAIAEHQALAGSRAASRFATAAPAAAAAPAPRTRRLVNAQQSEFASVIAEHMAAVEARQAEESRTRTREEEFDLAAAIADHQATARARRAREAAQVGVLHMDGDDFVVTPPRPKPRRSDRRRELVPA